MFKKKSIPKYVTAIGSKLLFHEIINFVSSSMNHNLIISRFSASPLPSQSNTQLILPSISKYHFSIVRRNLPEWFIIIDFVVISYRSHPNHKKRQQDG